MAIVQGQREKKELERLCRNLFRAQKEIEDRRRGMYGCFCNVSRPSVANPAVILRGRSVVPAFFFIAVTRFTLMERWGQGLIDIDVSISSEVKSVVPLLQNSESTPRRRGYLLNEVAHSVVLIKIHCFARSINAALNPFT